MEDEILPLLDYVEDIGLQSLCRGNGHYVISLTHKGSTHTNLSVIHRNGSWEVAYTVAHGHVHRVLIQEGRLMHEALPEVRGYLAFHS